MGKNKTSARTVFANPFLKVVEPTSNACHGSKLSDCLAKLLQNIYPPKITSKEIYAIHKTELDELSKVERKSRYKSLKKKLKAAAPGKAQLKAFMTVGFKQCQRAMSGRSLCLLLFDGSVSGLDSLLALHAPAEAAAAAAAADQHQLRCTCIAVNELATITRSAFGFPALTVGFSHEIAADASNHFHELYELAPAAASEATAEQLIGRQHCRRLDCAASAASASAASADAASEDCADAASAAEAISLAAAAAKLASEPPEHIPRTASSVKDLYLYRPDDGSRSFRPADDEQNKEETKETCFGGQDFITLNAHRDSRDNPAEVKTASKKKKRPKTRQSTCYIPAKLLKM